MALVHELRRRFPPLIFLLALLSAFPPLSTDMYLPALPSLQQEWSASLVTINLTLVAFFVTYCVFLLLYGPLSDRYGRRPPLLAGLSVFIGACLFCVFAGSAGMMIAGRVCQGAGAAASSAIVFAVCKDLFTGQQRQRIFIQIGVIVAMAPMIAPIIGGWIMALLSWRWIFLTQGALAFVAFVGVLRMNESHRPVDLPSVAEVAGSYLRLLANGRYLSLLLTLSLTGIPVFAFIGGSSDLYMTRMGYSEHQFSLFFGFNAMAFAFAPLLFSHLSRRHATITLMPLGFAGMITASILLLCPWLQEPWRLTLPMFLLTFSFSFCRPAGNNLILEQVDRDVGAASSLMVFFYFLIGALAMWFFSLPWHDKITVLGLMGLIPVSGTLGFWLLIRQWLRPVAPGRRGEASNEGGEGGAISSRR